MKFSTKATYGLKAILYLADHYGENAVPVSFISQEESISAPYLEQILSQLKKKGWVQSIRGPRGGYILTEKPNKISVASVLKSLGEPIGVSSVSKKKASNTKAQIAADLFWKNLSDGFSSALDKITLQDLLLRAESGGKNQSQARDLTFSI